MKALTLLPILLGGVAVIQAGMNKTIAQTAGLATASLINGCVFALCALLVFLMTYFAAGAFPEAVAFPHGRGLTFKGWYLLPGLIGFLLVFFLPLVMMKTGALPVFLGAIAGQIIAGLLWDAYFENSPVDAVRVAGAVMVFAGAILVIWKR